MSSQPPIPFTLLLPTILGLISNTVFAVGSLTLTHFPIQIILLPSPEKHALLSAKRSYFLTPLAPKYGPGQRHALPAASTAMLLRTWVYVFLKGARAFPSFAVSAGVCYVFCARAVPGRIMALDSDGGRKALYILAAVLSLAIFPFTQTVLRNTNEKLYEKVEARMAMERVNGAAVEEKEDEEEKREIAGLIAEWGRWNAVRSLLPILAGGLVMTALFW
jgi:Domain of unknown function (DUF1772)